MVGAAKFYYARNFFFSFCSLLHCTALRVGQAPLSTPRRRPLQPLHKGTDGISYRGPALLKLFFLPGRVLVAQVLVGRW